MSYFSTFGRNNKSQLIENAITPWILKLNMTMWKYASPVVRMFLSIHAKFVDNALYKARRALGE